MFCEQLIRKGHTNAIVLKAQHLITESHWETLYRFSPGFEEAMLSLMKTFLPKEPEASVPASAAAATDDRGGFE
jgi:hypothetical protein